MVRDLDQKVVSLRVVRNQRRKEVASTRVVRDQDRKKVAGIQVVQSLHRKKEVKKGVARVPALNTEASIEVLLVLVPKTKADPTL